ncbi:hypothetical protein ACLB2K_019140 [Fragaria x ananassa]
MPASNYLAAPNDIENQIKPLETSLYEELVCLSPLSSSCCINIVPYHMRVKNEQAYTPKVVSIGPLHHGNDAFKAMEEHKKRYLSDYLDRTKVHVEDYIKRIRQQEARLRDCYAETIELSRDEFVRMVAVDAAFLIELLIRFEKKDFQRDGDRLFGNPNLFYDVRPDLFLLENQLPFFILENVFDLYTRGIEGVVHSRRATNELLVEICTNFIFALVGGEPSKKEHSLALIRGTDMTRLQHFVDLIYIVCRQPFGARSRGKPDSLIIPTITELHHAGVEFKTTPNKTKLFDLGIEFSFSDGVLIIPNFVLNLTMGDITLNMIAYEQCYVPRLYLSDCVTLIKDLVRTPGDVELLVDKGVVTNLFSTNEMASTLINDLAQGVRFNTADFIYATLCNDLNKYCRMRRHKWMATLRQDYFNTPWTTISVVAAAFVIILTLIQTVCTVASC